MNYVHVGLTRAKVFGPMRESRCVCVYGVRVGAVVIQRVWYRECDRESVIERERNKLRERDTGKKVSVLRQNEYLTRAGKV